MWKRGEMVPSIMMFGQSKTLLFQLQDCSQSPKIFLTRRWGSCSSRAASLPRQWACSQHMDGRRSVTLFKGRGKKCLLLEMDVTERGGRSRGTGSLGTGNSTSLWFAFLCFEVRTFHLASSCPAPTLHHIQITQWMRYLDCYIRQTTFVYITLSFSQTLASPSSWKIFI